MKRILAALLSFALCLALLFFVRSEPDEPILHVALKSSGEQDAAYVYGNGLCKRQKPRLRRLHTRHLRLLHRRLRRL